MKIKTSTLRRNPLKYKDKEITLTAMLVPNQTTYSFLKTDEKSNGYHHYYGQLDLGGKTLLYFDYSIHSGFSSGSRTCFSFAALKASEGEDITVTGKFYYSPEHDLSACLYVGPGTYEGHKIETSWKSL